MQSVYAVWYAGLLWPCADIPAVRSVLVEPELLMLPPVGPGEPPVEPVMPPPVVPLVLPLTDPLAPVELLLDPDGAVDGLLRLPDDVEPEGLDAEPDVDEPEVLGEALGLVLEPEPLLIVACASRLHASKSDCAGVAANATVHTPATARAVKNAVARVNVAMVPS